MSAELAVQDDQLELGHLNATICAELAAGLTNAAGIKERYSISDAQWERLKINATFRSMLKEALERFTGDIGSSARIKMKAEILLEDSLPVLDKIIHDSDTGSGPKLDSIKQLSVLAEKTGGGKDKERGMSGAGFNVGIYINTIGGNDAMPPTIITIPVDED